MHTPTNRELNASPPQEPPSVASMPSLPRPPSPSADQGIAPEITTPAAIPSAVPDPEAIDVFTLDARAALKLLCTNVEALVRFTGDIPPTPPTSRPSTPSLGVIRAEKEDVAREVEHGSRRHSLSMTRNEEIENVPAKATTPLESSEGRLSEPLRIFRANVEPLSVQHGAITRKFYSKKPPSIALEDYLLRLHKYCPMSTAVYLATSLYLYRLAVLEQIIPVIARNVHRLVLAGLRVAMKALEDLSYPHQRFAKVGGVSEVELGRLEISFCFVTNFELKVDKEMLLAHAKTVQKGAFSYAFPVDHQPKLPSLKENCKIVIVQTRPLTAITPETPAATQD